MGVSGALLDVEHHLCFYLLDNQRSLNSHVFWPGRDEDIQRDTGRGETFSGKKFYNVLDHFMKETVIGHWRVGIGLD